MIEDQADSGYLVSTAVNSLSSVPSPITTSPWTPDEVTATTNATTATNVYTNTDNTTSLPPTGNNIPVNSSTSASDSVLLPGGGLLTGKVCAHDEPSSAAANSASDSKASSTMNILEWFTQGSLVKSKPSLIPFTCSECYMQISGSCGAQRSGPRFMKAQLASNYTVCILDFHPSQYSGKPSVG